MRGFRLSLVVAVTACSSSGLAMDLSLNGFGSVYYAQALDRELTPASLGDTDPNFTTYSLMGLNLAAIIDERLDFAAQLVALGQPVGTTDSFGLIAQWAHVNYAPCEGTSLRFGRQLHPVLIASEYVRVGYLLPFRQVPAPVFDLYPFTRFDGLSAYQAIETGAGRLTFGFFGGTPILDLNETQVSGLDFSFENLLRTQITLDGEGWRVRAQASRFLSRLQTSTPYPSTDRSGVLQAYSLGYRFDKDNFVSWGEYFLSRSPHGTDVGTGIYGDQAYGFYGLAGYRLGRWLPRYTFAKARQSYNITTNGSVTTHTFGVNYQPSERAVVKVEYERFVIPRAQGGGYSVTQPATTTATSGGAVYAGLDFIF